MAGCTERHLCAGGLVTGSGYVGTLIFGLIKRALIPFGLHHVFYMPFWQTAVGGTMEVAGQMVQGGQNIFFAQLADSANVAHFSADATRYFSGEFIFMIFGLPGAALAMYHCAKPEKKKQQAVCFFPQHLRVWQLVSQNRWNSLSCLLHRRCLSCRLFLREQLI